MSELAAVYATLEPLSYQDLEEVATRASILAKEKKKIARNLALGRIEEEAKAIGAKVKITLPDDSPAKRRGVMPVTHQDPSNPKNVWRGMGPKPGWLKARLAAGELLDSFKVGG